MVLFFSALRREAKRLNENNISLRIIGDRSRFHPELQAAMREAEALTAGRWSSDPANRRQLRWPVDIAQAGLALGAGSSGGAFAPGRHHAGAAATLPGYR